MKRYLIALFISAFFLSCGDFSPNEKKEVETVLALDEKSSIRKNGISLVPIINEVAEEPLELKSEVQNGNALTLRFDVDLESDEELHFTINNGLASKAKNTEIKLDLLEGNNVVFVCLSNTVGACSSYWVKNYFNGNGNGSFDTTGAHLFQHVTRVKEGIVIDYQIMNWQEGQNAALQLDTTRYILTPKTSYLLQKERAVRIVLLDSKGELLDGPFNDTGVMEVGGELEL